tara:strand:- start:1806 stop:2639 length:834 start_codon:yes stop_codon:yes gene_type:complete
MKGSKEMKLPKASSYVYTINPEHDLYQKLFWITGNRPMDINNQNVKKITKSLQDEGNYLYANPIKVIKGTDKQGDTVYQVIDGQTRYTAAKFLNEPIEIHIVPDRGKKQKLMAILNSNQKNWGLGDFAHLYACKTKTKSTYKKYLKYFDKFKTHGPGITHGMLIALCEGRTKREGDNILFKKGKLPWSKGIEIILDDTLHKLQQLQYAATTPPITKRTLKKQQFQTGLYTALANPEFSFDKFIKNLYTTTHCFNKLAKSADMLTEIYRIELDYRGCT